MIVKDTILNKKYSKYFSTYSLFYMISVSKLMDCTVDSLVVLKKLNK